MSTEKRPSRRSVPFPEVEMLPRSGKIRLGNMVPTADGKRMRPSKLPFFRVDTEESGITSPEAAAAFHDQYGDEPTTLQVMLPGVTPEDVFESRWRLYGTGGLKLSCDGVTCDRREDAGGWSEEPCVCAALGVPEKTEAHCKLIHTLQVILPDVRGLGVWQISTGSEISLGTVSSFLKLVHDLRGSVGWQRFFLDLVPTKVRPGGMPGTVYTLRLRDDASLTPQQLLDGDVPDLRATLERPVAERPALPAPVDDDIEDPLLNSPEGGTDVVDAVAIPPSADSDDRSEADAGSLSALTAAANLQIRQMDAKEKAALSLFAREIGLSPSSGALAQAYGERVRDLNRIVKRKERP